MNRDQHDRRTRSSGTSAVNNRPGLTLVEFLVPLGIIIVLIALFLPAIRRGGETPRRVQCRNNLKQIALALHNYHDAYQAFPPAYTVDETGQPLHSWRTLILPFLEQRSLYNSIDLSKPWDDPANAAAHETMPPAFRCPSNETPANSTTYMAVVGPDACLHPTQPRPLSEITDGTSNTLMLIEVSPNNAVHWMAPQDVGIRFALTFNEETELAHEGGTHAALADGSVRFLSARMSDANRQALITVAGGETLSEF